MYAAYVFRVKVYTLPLFLAHKVVCKCKSINNEAYKMCFDPIFISMIAGDLIDFNGNLADDEDDVLFTIDILIKSHSKYPFSSPSEPLLQTPIQW